MTFELTKTACSTCRPLARRPKNGQRQPKPCAVDKCIPDLPHERGVGLVLLGRLCIFPHIGRYSIPFYRSTIDYPTAHRLMRMEFE